MDLAPVVQVLERNEKLLTRTTELLEQQGEVLVMQHNDLLQLQAMVTNSISMISAMVPIALTLAGTIFLVKKAMSWFKGMAKSPLDDTGAPVDVGGRFGKGSVIQNEPGSEEINAAA